MEKAKMTENIISRVSSSTCVCCYSQSCSQSSSVSRYSLLFLVSGRHGQSVSP